MNLNQKFYSNNNCLQLKKNQANAYKITIIMNIIFFIKNIRRINVQFHLTAIVNYQTKIS